MACSLIPRSRATSATFRPVASKSITRRRNSAGYPRLPGPPRLPTLSSSEMSSASVQHYGSSEPRADHSNLGEDGATSEATRYPPELREGVMRMARDHQDERFSEWAAIQSIAGKLGITPETLRLWLR